MSEASAFTGSVPQTYHGYLGPLLFEPYARDLIPRLRLGQGDRVLELAAGTGIVTRELVRHLPEHASLVATDLNEAMLNVARGIVDAHPRLEFRTADGCSLPFPDGSFDVIVCQFGVMFFADKVESMREARRVLAPGGRYVFNVWDSLAHNPIPRIVHESLLNAFPENPPQFLAKLPYGYSDLEEIERTVRAGGFTRFSSERVQLPCTAPTAEDAARGYIEGTPVLPSLIDRGVTNISPVRLAAARSLAAAFGERPCNATMRAIVVTAS